MKSQWIIHAAHPNLILFFNGWGMDRHIVSHLDADADTDVLMVYDYGKLTFADGAWPGLSAYQRVDVLAWSMGVWAYATVHKQFAGQIRKAVALNGTPLPIDNEYGIPERVYAATVQQFSERSREKFFRRMCGTPETVRWFRSHQPQRTLEEQREELLAIKRAARQRQHSTPPFTCALIGRRDKIIPAQHQLNYWQGTLQYTMIDSPHCAFRRWAGWKEIFDDVATD